MLSDLTGVPSRDWVTLAVLLVAVVLIARSIPMPTGTPRQRHPLPAIAGLIMLGFLIFFSRLPPDLPSRIGARPIALAGTAALAVIALALVDFLFLKVVPAVRAILVRVGLPSAPTRHVALALALIPVVASSALLAWRTSLVVTDVVGQVGLLEEFDLPGDPLGITMVDKVTGYLTLGQGTILRFKMPAPGGQLQYTTVADGLEYPRGITLANGRLFVAEIGALPCRPAYPTCDGGQLAAKPMDGERAILKSARGRISSYDIDATGSLSHERTVLSDLPVVSHLHAVNGLATGPDGNLYLAIGNVDALWKDPVIDAATTPHPEWLGTILRIDPGSGTPEVFARGLRNVYGLTFDERGGLWGVDNNGPAMNEWRAEELLQIKLGRNYGYPMDGTFGRHSQRDDAPVWTMSEVGSAGILWAGEASMAPGVFVGSCQGLNYQPLRARGDAWTVQNLEDHAFQEVHLLDVSGCVTALSAVGPRTLLATVLGFAGKSKLLRITLASAQS